MDIKDIIKKSMIQKQESAIYLKDQLVRKPLKVIFIIIIDLMKIIKDLRNILIVLNFLIIKKKLN